MSDARKAYEQAQAMEPDAPVVGPDEGVSDEEPPVGTGSGVPDSDGYEGDAAGEPNGATSVEDLDDIEATSAAQPATAPDDAEAAEIAGAGGRSAEELAAALADAERQRDDYLDHLRRERAEFDNFRKRNARERLQAMDRGVQSLLTELLGVLDNFGHVLAAAEDSPDQALAKGAAMVHEELMGVLSRFGLENVPGEGSTFDPRWHEAMMQVESEEDLAEPVVVEVLRPGYRFKGRVLRPASVSVAQ